MSQQKIKHLTLSALFAALIFIATAYLPRFSLGSSGYIHIGDAFIYIAASFLPLPYAIIAAAIGGSLADILTGYAIWAPFTFVIKALLVISFTNKKPTLLGKRNLIACIVALPITTFGYYFAQAAIEANFVTPLANLIPNLVQAVCSAVIYIAVALALDKAKIKERLG
ncbi:MAG: TIGR04002 family protein [Eubacteriales bacterium]|nr:TIGR04002 family protein [Eubacteriales bacterium]MDD4475336.1 TIGR04002 family protein [Eubacteriales bacterium]